jgi:UDP-glucose 4-epimerase
MADYLVTGGGGFIGSNLVRALLEAGDAVRVLDDFSTGRRSNLAGLEKEIRLFEGSILDEDLLARAMRGAACCLHQAAVPSVPRSVADPLGSNAANVEGTLKVFLAARAAGVRRVVHASSSSVYGNVPEMPLREDLPRNPISPYGISKAAAEMYGESFAALYDMEIVALRYFNVFGPRQDPASQYAAVIPIFITRMLRGEGPPVFGDGLQARDFSYVENVVSANLLAARREARLCGVYNVACGASTSLLELAAILNALLGTDLEPEFHPPRAGDIRNSWADIQRAETAFGYRPVVSVKAGLEKTIAWIQEEETGA